ncbi:WXG100 family type VII secretion target [Prauserella oleivorans]
MSAANYPALGFDPARGNVGTVRNLAKQMSDTATYAREAHEVLRSIESKKDVWTGEASRAFAERLGELPGYVDSAHTSLRDAGKALNTWGDRLEAHQKRARELEEQARQAIDAAEQADAAAQHANASANTPVMHDGSPASVSAAQRRCSRKPPPHRPTGRPVRRGRGSTRSAGRPSN